MRAQWLSCGLWGWVLGCALVLPLSVAAAEGRPWSVSDSAKLRYFLYDLAAIEPLTGSQKNPASVPAALSPDGSHFFFVAYSGDLERDEIVGQLSVFSVSSVRAALKRGQASLDPLHLIELRSKRGGDWQAPIIQPHWVDAQAIAFVGTEGRGSKQLYYVDIVSGERLQLTHAAAGEDVIQNTPMGRSYEVFTQSGHGPTIVYKTEGLVPKSSVFDTRLDEYPASSVGLLRGADDPISTLFFPWKSILSTARMHAIYRGGEPRVLLEGYSLGPWLSPDGQYAVVGAPIKQRPVSWSGYEGLAEPLPWMPSRQFHLVDLRTGEMRPMLDAPTGKDLWAEALWSKDSDRVLLVNTRLPLTGQRVDEATQSYVIDYRIKDGMWTEVSPIEVDGLRIHNAQWDQPHRRVLLEWATRDNKRAEHNSVLTDAGGRWTSRRVVSDYTPAVGSAAAWPSGLRVYVDEDMNTPQTMVAAQAGRTIALSAPDPALAGVHRQSWEQVDVAFEGREIRGYLLPPVGVQGPAPLVILMADLTVYGEQFLPDGARFSGFAGQALAAQGMAVLHLESPAVLRTEKAVVRNDDIFLTPKEGPAHVRIVDAAVDMLVERGVADAGQVGLVGFSRSGYYVYYVISHPGRHAIKSAVVFDSVDAGYGSYVNSMAIGQSISVYDRQYAVADPQTGVVPNFWANKQAWMDAPAFNLDRVNTPTLFSVTGRQNAWAMMETVGGWRYMKLPFEYRMYPESAHVLTRPKEREDALRGTVEWMDFWLQGRKPQDEQRAVSWESLRTQWSPAVSGAGHAGSH